MTEDEVIEHNEPIDDTAEPVSHEPSMVNKQPRSKKKWSPLKRFVVFGSIFVVLVALGLASWWWVSTQNSQTPQTTITTVDSTQTTPSDPLSRFISPTTGETWLTAPKTITNQGYIAGETDTTYYEVGKRGNSTIIMTVSQGIGTFVQLFEKSADGTISYIARANAYGDYSSDTDTETNGLTSEYFAKGVVIDKTTHYDSLSMPTALELGNGESVSPPSYTTLGDYLDPSSTNTTTKIATVKKFGSSTLLKIERAYVDTGLTAVNYALDTPISTRINLTYQPINSKVDEYNWTNKLSTSGTIGGIVRGCGAVGSSVSRSDILSDNDFTAIGKTNDGKTIYGFKDSTAALPKVAYDEYKDFNTYDSGPTILSYDAFLENHAIFAYKSPNNGWLIYTIDNFAAVGGCGKPVVYLYPTKTESVNVKVGATVKVSEPLYNQATGWLNVIAQPNGQLTYNGKSYDSLFWEGTGYGNYPGISAGSVVVRKDVISTITSQLAAQGLNQRETNDFMAYWQNQIPNTPYVRLAWFNTAALNELAPLHITPAPRTLIRVFLDMKGLDRPINIPSQTFIKPVRDGFTVVEWGGLLHTKI